jgi:hypothetical protein
VGISHCGHVGVSGSQCLHVGVIGSLYCGLRSR